METTIYFVLGVASALGIVCLGYTLFTTLRISKQVNLTKRETESISHELDVIYRRIDDVQREINDRIDHDVHKRIDEAFSHIDSRIDKTLSTVYAAIAETENNLTKK
jgi:hypothetical protein